MSQCICHDGYTGSDCNTKVLGLVAQKGIVVPGGVHHSKNLSLAAHSTHHGHELVPGKKKHAAPPPTGEQFGIPEVNDIGHTGVQVSECDDNCFFRGVCHDGQCFCQPGFYGKKCQMEKTSEKGTVSLVTLLLVGGGCTLVSFSIMTLLLHLSMQSKRAKETELGYNI